MTYPIEDISESTVLNVTINRTKEEELALDRYLADVAKFRSQLVKEFGIWFRAGAVEVNTRLRPTIISSFR